jgi:hypothetical protein
MNLSDRKALIHSGKILVAGAGYVRSIYLELPLAAGVAHTDWASFEVHLIGAAPIYSREMLVVGAGYARSIHHELPRATLDVHTDN